MYCYQFSNPLFHWCLCILCNDLYCSSWSSINKTIQISESTVASLCLRILSQVIIILASWKLNIRQNQVQIISEAWCLLTLRKWNRRWLMPLHNKYLCSNSCINIKLWKFNWIPWPNKCLYSACLCEGTIRYKYMQG